MRKWILIVTLAGLSGIVNAADGVQKINLDKVIFQTSAKQWATTQSALLTVSINATLSDADLVKARAEIVNNLNKIAAGEWQLTQFERSQDNSGLEKLFVSAQARVPQASLTNSYKNAKDVSKPGASYSINGIEFKPSLEEIQQVKAQVRERLYQQINAELIRLNKIYTQQNYSLHRIVFFEGDQLLPLAKTRELTTMAVTAAAATPPAVAVSNEVIMGAMVELASNRQGGVGGPSN